MRAGERWLNLFCHTGAFSVVLLSRGAEVVSVDISKRYLGWLEENLELNGLEDAPHQSVAADARAYLAGGTQLFDGIIVDPPTSAAGPKGFWSIRKDFSALLVSCFSRLAPGGQMLVCRNDRRREPTLDALIQDAADQADWKLRELVDAPPAIDYPRRSGFPEGDSFEGRWVR